MRSPTLSSSCLREDDFAQDKHAARYRGELTNHPEAMRRLIELLNDPANEQRLLDAEEHGMPALTGIIRQVEAEPSIERVLLSGQQGHRFRQAVGVSVKLKMSRLGWRATGRKGTVRGARYFTKAEHYESDRPGDDDYLPRALAALDLVDSIGDDHERAETGHELMEAIAATRAREGRVF